MNPTNVPEPEPRSLRLLSKWHSNEDAMRPLEREDSGGELVVCGELARSFAVVIDHESAATGGAVVALYGDAEGDSFSHEPLAVAHVPAGSRRPIRALVVRGGGYRSYRLTISSQQGRTRVLVIADASTSAGGASVVQAPSTVAAFANAGWIAPANLPTIEKGAEQITTQVAQVSSTGAAVFPAAAAPTDNAANPTVSQLQTFGMVWDGATWDRAPGNSADGAKVDTELAAAAALADAAANPTTATVGAVGLGFNGATLDRLRAGLTALATTFTGFLNVLGFSIYEATPTARADGEGGPMRSDKRGALRVNGNANPASSSAITPGDATVIDCPGGLWVGTAGNIVGRLKDDASDRTFKVAQGFCPGWFIAVRATGTTAADIVGYGV